MDFTEINAFLLKRTNVYRNYLISSMSADKEKLDVIVAELLDDMKDDYKFWSETLIKCEYKVPLVLEKTWNLLDKEICKTVSIISNIKILRGI